MSTTTESTSKYVPKKDELKASISDVLNDNEFLKEKASVKAIKQAIEKENPNWKVSEKKVKKIMKKERVSFSKETTITEVEPRDDISASSSTATSTSQRLLSMVKRKSISSSRSVTSTTKRLSIFRRKSKKDTIDTNMQIQVERAPPQIDTVALLPSFDGQETDTEEHLLDSPVGLDQGTAETMNTSEDKKSEQEETLIDPEAEDKSKEKEDMDDAGGNEVTEVGSQQVTNEQDGVPKINERDVYSDDDDGENKEMICEGCVVM